MASSEVGDQGVGTAGANAWNEAVRNMKRDRLPPGPWWDERWLLAITVVRYSPPVRLISFTRQRKYASPSPFHQQCLRSATEHPWSACLFSVNGSRIVSARGVTPLAAMHSCWARFAGYLINNEDDLL